MKFLRLGTKTKDSVTCPYEKCNKEAFKVSEGALWTEYRCPKCKSRRVILKEGTPRLKKIL